MTTPSSVDDTPPPPARSEGGADSADAASGDDAGARGLLRAGESVLFIDRKEREYLRTLKPGGRVHLRGGSLHADDLIGGPEGRVVSTGSEDFLLLRPTFAALIPHLPRRAQVIYPKDIGPILMWGDIGPGMRVLEVGTGPGALTMAMLRAIGPTGTLYSYELRPEFAEMARANIAQFHGPAPQWIVKVADIHDGIAERDLDRMVIDLAEPWRVLPAAAGALRPGGVLIVWVPTVPQVKQFVDAARLGGFGAVQVMETMQRPWHVQGLSIRPEHRMVAHTGFLTVCRRLAPGTAVAVPTDASEDPSAGADDSENDPS